MAWNLVRARRLGGLKFRRQHRIGDYILDFYCPALRLGIELDGEPHFTDVGNRSDQIRTAYLEAHGITIIRFENQDVIANPSMVCAAILVFADTVRG